MVTFWRRRDIMRDVLRAKFAQEGVARTCLLGTGAVYLEEANWWRDTYWGKCNGFGLNVLGGLLMELRAELSLPDKET